MTQVPADFDPYERLEQALQRIAELERLLREAEAKTASAQKAETGTYAGLTRSDGNFWILPVSTSTSSAITITGMMFDSSTGTTTTTEGS